MKLRNLTTASIFAIATTYTNQDAHALQYPYLFVCQSCAAGTYSDGTLEKCKECPAGQYSQGNAGSCSTCNAGTYSNKGANQTGSTGCNICSAGTYSTKGSSSCTRCPAGKYSGAGASSCSSCSSTSYGTWGGNCGTVTRSVTSYCTKAGSTSSTGNSSTTTESTTLYCSGHSSCSASTNGTCTSCSKPSYSSWNSTSGCGWSCNGGYYRSGNNCKLRIYAYYKTVNNCAGNEQSGYFSVTEYDYEKEITDGVSYTYNGRTTHDRVIFSSTHPGSHSEKRGCTPEETKNGKSYDTASTRLTPVNESSYLNLSETCTDGAGLVRECAWNKITYTWTRK